MKKVLFILTLASALNLSFNSTNTFSFERNRISITISSKDDLASAVAVREIRERRCAIRASDFLAVLLIEKCSCRNLDTA